jgi:hypothetical protein
MGMTMLLLWIAIGCLAVAIMATLITALTVGGEHFSGDTEGQP